MVIETKINNNSILFYKITSNDSLFGQLRQR